MIFFIKISIFWLGFRFFDKCLFFSKFWFFGKCLFLKIWYFWNFDIFVFFPRKFRREINFWKKNLQKLKSNFIFAKFLIPNFFWFETFILIFFGKNYFWVFFVAFMEICMSTFPTFSAYFSNFSPLILSYLQNVFFVHFPFVNFFLL